MKVRLPIPRFIKKIFKPLVVVYEVIMARVRKNIRAELILTFFICLVLSFFVFLIAGAYIERTNRVATVDYSDDVRLLANRTANIVNAINEAKCSINDKSKIEEIIMDNKNNSDKVIISDLDGKVLYKSNNAAENQIDIYTIIKNAMENSSYYQEQRDVQTERHVNNPDNTRKEYTNFYPVSFSDGKAYVVLSGIPEGNITYYNNGNSFLAFVIACISFIFIFLYLTKKKMLYFQQIANGLIEISKGDLGYRVKKVGDDELASLANNINFMAEALNNQIEMERQAERVKNELITNVSHDLRTPLTSIMGYLGLIKEKKYSDEEQMAEYLNIAFSKSEKLKLLIEDLFEYTKLTNEGIVLNKQSIAINEFLEQLVEELVPICESSNVKVIKNMPSGRVMANVDVDKTLRVFENLLMNAIKYSYKPGDIYLNMAEENEKVIISVANKGDNIPKEELDKIFDRFYRVEKSRSSDTGGSGLGLAIAKNIVELHGGKIWAECIENEITFHVSLDKV